jgi:F-type H+-transporting ATPase subunit delta
VGDTAVTIRYAEALYELANEAGKTGEILADLAALKASFESNFSDYSKLIHARVPLAEKLRIAQDSFLKERDPLVRNTFLLMIKKNRQDCLAGFFMTYLELHEEHEGVIRMTVETPSPLSQEVSDAISKQVADASGRKVVIETRTDASLLGGMRFQLGSKLLDASLKTRLDRLQRRLKSVPIESTNS